MPLVSFDLFRFILLFISIMSRAQCKVTGFGRNRRPRSFTVHLASRRCRFSGWAERLINSDTVPVGVMALEDTLARIEWDANLHVCVACVGRMYHSIG